jgi:esterase/lipase superfamily enzyme
MRSPSFWFALLLSWLFAGCDMPGSGGTGSSTTDQPIASAIFGNGSFREVAFITLRNRTGDNRAAHFFGDERSSPVFGYCDVSRTPVKPLQPIAENAPFYISDEVLALESIREQPLEALWKDLDEGPAGLRPLLYTHGYYISFERGCKRASIFQHSLGLARRFLLFSWPSDGAMLNYTRDESDLYWSVSPLAEVLVELADVFGAGGFDVAAHSLGTRGVFLALLLLAGEESRPRPMINHLVLLAPDIDTEIFEQSLDRIRPLAAHITIYVSGNDTPLSVSRQVHGYPRLGEAGTHLDGLEGVDIVDLSDAGVRYPSGHVYHLHHPGVINDLNALLIEGKPARSRENLERSGQNTWRLQPKTSGKAANSK